MVASPPRSEATPGVQTYGNYIAGEWRSAASGETMENRNPANRDEVIGLFASSGAADVDAAIAAADEATAPGGSARRSRGRTSSIRPPTFSNPAFQRSGAS